jgi:prepilin-type N-terminal cleavage/methylation domain-containing protein
MLKQIDVLRREKGLTLIELLIAIVITLIGSLAGYAFLASVRGTVAGNSAVVESQQEARFTVERMARELRESDRDKVWPNPIPEGGSHYIIFFTPRDENRSFVLDEIVYYGRPEWQRTIAYVLGENSTLYRYQIYNSPSTRTEPDMESLFRSEPEVVSKNVERLSFTRDKDLFTISIRTFSDKGDKIGNVAPSYADFNTTIKLRN